MDDSFTDEIENENFAPNETSDESGEAEQDNPPAPIAETFDELLKGNALLEPVSKLGFSRPTEIQARGILPAITGKDLIMEAKTGSGKTLAYVVPLLHHLLAAQKAQEINQPFALVLVPTRELALQVKEVILSLVPDISPVCVIGGVEQSKQEKELEKDPRVVIGTPGRVLDLLKQKILRLKHCEFFTLDEVDEMLSIGFIDDVRTILSRLPDRRQGLFVSATITPRVEMLANSFLTKPEIIATNASEADKPAIEHFYCEVGGDLMAKPMALCDLIETMRPSSAIIFCNTKSDTQLVEALLRRRGFDARRINSDLSQSQRNRVMKKIRARDLQFLVATDIAARGIDIEQIELVINFAIHDQPEAYVHRTGRTGRAGRAGKAISLVGPRDFGSFHFLTKVLEVNFQKLPLPTEDEVAEARVSHLYEVIRQKEIELRDRDRVAARKLLSDMGGITEVSEDLETIIAKLSRYAVEHVVNQDAKSLDEELDAEPNRPQPSGDRGGDEEQGRGRQRRGRDDSRRDRDRRGDSRRGEERRGDDRRGEDRRSEDRPRGDRRDDRRGEDRRGDRRENRHSGNEAEGNQEQYEESRSESDTQPPREAPPTQVKIYVGQGSTHGMTAGLLCDLAKEFGGLEAEELKDISVREHYGFVRMSESSAKVFVENLNGIEYNGAVLPVEFAVSLADERGQRRHSDARSGGGRRGGRSGGGRDGNRDRSRGRSRDGGRGRGRGNRDSGRSFSN